MVSTPSIDMEHQREPTSEAIHQHSVRNWHAGTHQHTPGSDSRIVGNRILPASIHCCIAMVPTPFVSMALRASGVGPVTIPRI